MRQRPQDGIETPLRRWLDEPLDSALAFVQRMWREFWRGPQSTGRADSRQAVTGMPSVDELAQAALSGLLEASAPMSVKQMNHAVGHMFGISNDDPGLLRPYDQSETPFLLSMRHARLALQYEAAALFVQRQDASVEQDSDICVLRPNGRELSREDVSLAVSRHEARRRPLARELPSITEHAIEIHRAMQDSSHEMTVEAINRAISAAFALSDDDRNMPHNRSISAGETEFEFRARHARNALRKMAHVIVSTSTWAGGREGLRDTYALTLLGRSISETRVRTMVEGYNTFPPAGLVRPLLVVSEPAYDYGRWCWETLEAIRSLQADGGESFSNQDVSEALATRLGLDAEQRSVQSLLNPLEAEYKARCATMRVALQRMGLIERQPTDRSWRLLEDGMAAQRDDVEVRAREIVKSGALAAVANGAYPGNPKLRVAATATTYPGETTGDAGPNTELSDTPGAEDEPTSDDDGVLDPPVEDAGGPLHYYNYDPIRWCWETLGAVRRTTSESGGETGARNAPINEEMATGMNLSPRQRQVFGTRNPMVQDYKLRSAAMRVLLRELDFIIEGKGGWVLTGAGSVASEEDLAERITAMSEMPERTPGLVASAFDPGNPALEVEGGPSDTDAVGNAVGTGVNQLADALGSDGRVGMDRIAVHGVEGLGRERELNPSDREMCVALLKSLSGKESAKAGLTEDELFDALVEVLNVPDAYMALRGPPWGKKRSRLGPLLRYRFEHVLRALSIGQCGAIRQGDLQIADGRWFLTVDGVGLVETNPQDVWPQVAEYFSLHFYEDWRTDQWMVELIDVLAESGTDGTPFEYLCADLLAEMGHLDQVDVQGPGRLDSEGVDIVAKFRKEPIARVGTVDIFAPSRDSVLLVQCKRWLTEEVRTDAVSKLWAHWTQLKGSWTDDYESNGALLIVAGDLERQAELTFWTLDGLNAAGEESAATGGGADRAWSVWDGGRVLRLMRQYQVGVSESRDGSVSVDKEYIRALSKRRSAQ